ncbi:hypothetical protein [Halobaculum magnesiiphilum]|uniref:DUF8164 domain-containing protein n=1 Tax=Halobaculum magnesiiphilum TaxID=1017351 RepID=A0A8T8WFE3_9EURY|nr:hypothetical protein [Halobaculum magnesiiphilum]QZP38602.1 hypothetical protein K6T50_05535 [Halobaculum magnesiiphilum]
MTGRQRMSSAFSLIPNLQTPDVDRGDSVVVDLYIGGTTKLGENKLIINWDYEDLISEDPGEIILGYERETTTIKEYLEGEPEVTLATEVVNLDEFDAADELRDVGYVEDMKDIGHIDGAADLEIQRVEPASSSSVDNITHEINPSGASLTLPNWLTSDSSEFSKTSRAFDSGNPSKEDAPNGIPQITSEMRQDFPPFRLRLNIKDTATPGDYSIKFILFYNDPSLRRTFFDRQEVTFHVNSRREELEPIPTWIAVISGIVAVLSLAIQANIFTTAINILARVL